MVPSKLLTLWATEAPQLLQLSHVRHKIGKFTLESQRPVTEICDWMLDISRNEPVFAARRNSGKGWSVPKQGYS
jgi:hypothetical protein